MKIIVENRNTNEKVSFGNLDTAVEYLRHRLHETFTVYVDSNSKTQQIINKVRQECSNVLTAKPW